MPNVNDFSIAAIPAGIKSNVPETGNKKPKVSVEKAYEAGVPGGSRDAGLTRLQKARLLKALNLSPYVAEHHEGNLDKKSPGKATFYNVGITNGFAIDGIPIDSLKVKAT